MKSEFILAFNEICEARGLHKEDVFDALRTALVSAYRRDTNISTQQGVSAEIDPRTGEPTIYTEKEVVDSIFDNRTEVLLEVAQAAGYPEAEYGDLVMVDSTTSSFGRIAAQTAKQVLLQRVREAERDQLFDDFSDREGELVNGTVQSVSGQHITIGLGRTEAILPKSQQVQGERYRPHDKIRVYMLEVRRTNRGPQIFVSRNHRNLLRRLLELEVPEIYNGQVEIKSIAREAGQRSKVAVLALQPGVDPVGACVGMRGVRIQSIVRELNDEKIDVIEWDASQETFIAKALSPARVSHVFLEDHPDDGKTAVVVVPDDQLSLAIGREGQNARLAAKLTGWRIDIKSLTEAAGDSMKQLDHAAVDASVAKDEEYLASVELILSKKAAGRPITSEDYRLLDNLVGRIEGRIISARAIEHEQARKDRAAAKSSIPQIAFTLPLDDLDLPGRIHNLLLDNEIETVGNAMYTLALGEDVILEFRGFGEAALDTLKEHIANFEMPEPEVEEAEAVEGAELVAEVTDEVAEAAVETDDVVTEAVVVGDTAVIEPSSIEEELVEVVTGVEAQVAPIEDQLTVVDEEVVLEETAVVEEEVAVAEVEEKPAELPFDDLSQPLIVEEPKKPAPKKPAKQVRIARQTAAERRAAEEEEENKNKARKGRQLVFNEDAGEVVVKRKRKGSRSRPNWEDIDIDELDEF